MYVIIDNNVNVGTYDRLDIAILETCTRLIPCQLSISSFGIEATNDTQTISLVRADLQEFTLAERQTVFKTLFGKGGEAE